MMPHPLKMSEKLLEVVGRRSAPDLSWFKTEVSLGTTLKTAFCNTTSVRTRASEHRRRREFVSEIKNGERKIKK